MLLAALLLHCGAGSGGPRDIPGRPVERRIVNQLPDLAQPWIMKRFKCSACENSVREFIGALRLARAASSTPLGAFEAEDILQGVCVDVMPLQYGVSAAVASGAASDLEFVKSSRTVSVVKGGLLGRVLESVCQQVLESMSEQGDDDLLRRVDSSVHAPPHQLCAELELCVLRSSSHHDSL